MLQGSIGCDTATYKCVLLRWLSVQPIQDLSCKFWYTCPYHNCSLLQPTILLQGPTPVLCIKQVLILGARHEYYFSKPCKSSKWHPNVHVLMCLHEKPFHAIQ
ncbi:hypothetical protein XENTR_v10009312 [Xenopus tropicalis]|nr:hypothetical protein XENTR_v10009312 [Xenopus tropicalis]